ncbi:MAG: hypothetical protein ACHQIG_12040 [Acidimicrobiia bacterium]
MDEAAILMDRPPGGWADLVTNEHLDLKLAALESRVMGALHQELRAQTWRLLAAVLASMSVLTAVFGLIVILATR